MTDREIPWHTDANGLLRGAAYHDGELCEFSRTRGGRFHLLIAPVHGGWTKIDLQGVESFGFRDFTEGGIVNDIRIWRLGKMAPPNGNAEDDPWRVLFCHIHDLDGVRRVAEHLAERRPDDFLFLLDTAFAGAFAAHCTKIALFETPP